MKHLNKTAYNFSVSLLITVFYYILNFLNKKESRVICMREFEIILLDTQSQGRTQDFLPGGAHRQWGTNNYI
jgi:hypothetical protein